MNLIKLQATTVVIFRCYRENIATFVSSMVMEVVAEVSFEG